MPVNSLFVVNEKYSFLHNAVINDLRISHSKNPTTNAALSEKRRLHNEAAIKEMITALEETVKILEKKVYDLKKEQKLSKE